MGHYEASGRSEKSVSRRGFTVSANSIGKEERKFKKKSEKEKKKIGKTKYI